MTLMSSTEGFNKQHKKCIIKILLSSLAKREDLFASGILFTYLFIFRVTPEAYGGSEARGQIRASAAGLATQDPSRICDLHHSSQQCWILNPLSEARDQIHLLMDISWVCYC